MAMEVEKLIVNEGNVYMKAPGWITIGKGMGIDRMVINSIRIVKINVKEWSFNAAVEGGMTALCWVTKAGYMEIEELLRARGNH
jgi:hypothetical protein